MTVVPKAEEPTDDVDMADNENGEEAVKEEPVQLIVKILKVEGAVEKYCAEFSRKGGNQLEFFDAFTKVRNEIADLATATK